MMRRISTLVLPAVLALVILAAYAPAAYSSHLSSLFIASGFTETENWIDFVAPCLLGESKPLKYPQNTGFFVISGWGDTPWMEDADKRSFESQATRFDFLIDGQLQMQTMFYFYSLEGGGSLGIIPIQPDTMAKLFRTELHDGLKGSHLFTGQFFLDASVFGGSLGEAVLVLECNTTVNFK